MDRMTEFQQAVTVGSAVFATILTRFLPYILLPAGKEGKSIAGCPPSSPNAGKACTVIRSYTHVSDSLM